MRSKITFTYYLDKLRQSIADNATTKQNQNYTDASPNKQDAYNNAHTTAQ
ncbi:FIVAR domain-containing protein, partial [Staphylococcus aureus]